MNKLTQLLGEGQRADAILFAIKNNMWPHALFLASSSSLACSIQPLIAAANELKVLKKVKARFLSSLPSNEPIKPFQLLNGRILIKASVHLFNTLEWNKWMLHLAIIISNVDETY